MNRKNSPQPASPEVAALLCESARLLHQIAELQSKRALLLSGLPYGTFLFALGDDIMRAGVRDQTSSHVSVARLRCYLDDTVIRRCTVRGAPRKSVQLTLAKSTAGAQS